MATINKRFIHFNKKSDFNTRYAESTDNGQTYGDFLGKSIVWIKDANEIWTHGQFYKCSISKKEVEDYVASKKYITAADIPNLTGGASATNGQYVSGVTVSGHAVTVTKGNLPAASSTTPKMDGTAAAGTGTTWARADHIHPTDTSRQEKLVSGTNIKKINGASLLGSGDIQTAFVINPNNGGISSEEFSNVVQSILNGNDDYGAQFIINDSGNYYPVQSILSSLDSGGTTGTILLESSYIADDLYLYYKLLEIDVEKRNGKWYDVARGRHESFSLPLQSSENLNDDVHYIFNNYIHQENNIIFNIPTPGNKIANLANSLSAVTFDNLSKIADGTVSNKTVSIWALIGEKWCLGHTEYFERLTVNSTNDTLRVYVTFPIIGYRDNTLQVWALDFDINNKGQVSNIVASLNTDAYLLTNDDPLLTINGTTYKSRGTVTTPDTKVTSVSNHYIPSGGTAMTSTASGNTLAYGGVVVTGVTKDAAGHITGLTTSKLPDAVTSVASATTATKLATPRSINGTNFNGSENITTANWGTARNISISDSTAANTGTEVSVNGSGNVTLKLPATIAASLSGNSTTASKWATAITLSLTGAVTGGVSIDGSNNVSLSTSLKTLTAAQIPNLDASKITSGTIDIARLPKGALERLVVVANESAAMSADIQEGDTVQVTGNNNKMYFCISNTATTFSTKFKEYTAGSATSVPWSGVTGKPTIHTYTAGNGISIDSNDRISAQYVTTVQRDTNDPKKLTIFENDNNYDTVYYGSLGSLAFSSTVSWSSVTNKPTINNYTAGTGISINNNVISVSNISSLTAKNVSNKLHIWKGSDVALIDYDGSKEESIRFTNGTGVSIANSLESDTKILTFNSTVYTFAGGTDGFTVTSSLGSATPETTTISVKPSVSNKVATLAWGTASTIATISGTNITVKMPSNPNTNTWRPIKVGSATLSDNSTTLTIQGSGGTSVSLSSGVLTISSTSTPAYTLPLASSSTRGGIKIGYSASGANIPVALSSELAYVTLTKSAITTALGLTPTANTGTVTSVTAGTGLTGSVTTTGSISAKLRSTTAISAASTNAALSGSKLYAVAVDKDGYLSVSVPWTDTNTDTHYTTRLHAGAATGASNNQTTNGNTYLKISDNNTVRTTVKIVGTGYTTVTSNDSGVITINSTSNSYTLPTASSSTLGGVKIGSNISISSGVISVTKSNVTTALGGTPSLILTETSLTSTTVTAGYSYSNSTARTISSLSGFTNTNTDAIVASTAKLSFSSGLGAKLIDGIDDLSGSYYVYCFHRMADGTVAINGAVYA